MQPQCLISEELDVLVKIEPVLPTRTRHWRQGSDQCPRSHQRNRLYNALLVTLKGDRREVESKRLLKPFFHEVKGNKSEVEFESVPSCASSASPRYWRINSYKSWIPDPLGFRLFPSLFRRNSNVSSSISFEYLGTEERFSNSLIWTSPPTISRHFFAWIPSPAMRFFLLYPINTGICLKTSPLFFCKNSSNLKYLTALSVN